MCLESRSGFERKSSNGDINNSGDEEKKQENMTNVNDDHTQIKTSLSLHAMYVVQFELLLTLLSVLICTLSMDQ